MLWFKPWPATRPGTCSQVDYGFETFVRLAVPVGEMSLMLRGRFQCGNKCRVGSNKIPKRTLFRVVTLSSPSKFVKEIPGLFIIEETSSNRENS